MKVEILLLCIIMVVLGIFIGIAISYILRPETVGAIKIYTGDPDGPYLFLELTDDGAESLRKNDEVIVKVIVDDYIPRKNNKSYYG